MSSELYVSAGFLSDDPTVRVRRTADSVHVEIDCLAILLHVDTARELRDKLTAEIGDPS